MSKPSISRRTVLGASLAATAASVLPAVACAATSAGGPDAALLKLAQEYWQIENGLTSMEAGPAPAFGTAAEKDYETRMGNLLESKARVLNLLANMHARTREGLRAKGAIVEKSLPIHITFNAADLDDPEIRLALSLARDVAGGSSL
ncbi:hypothetical protein [Acetobacter oryzoeni]|uniref:Uncharacterized protein n=1 Tax=Acetobacter oryzoeni TaxID=2500548 RepID=A0A5B9GEE1_9PROT|nr:hypothetical protein [Acetobacter oryzoeni]MCP1203173.1 hypothetical protein [Acetobacter oryzoeni]QEE84233.1 hypothetical protein EOV40_000110 [Acetobacter oryzoeni]